MKKVLFISLIFFISCNDDKKNLSSNSGQNVTENINNQEPTLERDSLNFDFNSLFNELKEIKGDSITFELIDQYLSNNKDILITENFHKKYLNNKNIFRSWIPKLPDSSVTSKHFKVGKVIIDEKHTLMIVRELFSIDATENKLFALVLNDKGNVIDIIQLSELTDYPGALITIKSVLIGNELKVIKTVEEIGNDYDEKTEKNNFFIKTTNWKYKLTENKKFVLTDSVFKSKEIWR